jgi:phage shock protein E
MKRISSAFLLIGLIGTTFACGASANVSPAGGKIGPEAAKSMLASDKGIVLLDVRTEEEFLAGHIANAILLPYDEINAVSAAKAIPTKASKVIVYCRSGRRSAIAVEALKGLGYEKLWDLGGLESWPYEVVK